MLSSLPSAPNDRTTCGEDFSKKMLERDRKRSRVPAAIRSVTPARVDQPGEDPVRLQQRGDLEPGDRAAGIPVIGKLVVLSGHHLFRLLRSQQRPMADEEGEENR